MRKIGNEVTGLWLGLGLGLGFQVQLLFNNDVVYIFTIVLFASCLEKTRQVIMSPFGELPFGNYKQKIGDIIINNYLVALHVLHRIFMCRSLALVFILSTSFIA